VYVFYDPISEYSVILMLYIGPLSQVLFVTHVILCRRESRTARARVCAATEPGEQQQQQQQQQQVRELSLRLQSAGRACRPQAIILGPKKYEHSKYFILISIFVLVF
jgi:hypothetical protein